jgi:phosphatidylglycerophosphate synthase
VLYAYYGWIPKWLAILVISRDLAVVAGWMAVYLTTRGKIPNPSWAGKSTILVEFVLICYIIINKNFTFLPSIYQPLIWLTAVLIVISGLHYVYREMKIASEE